LLNNLKLVDRENEIILVQNIHFAAWGVRASSPSPNQLHYRV